MHKMLLLFLAFFFLTSAYAHGQAAQPEARSANDLLRTSNDEQIKRALGMLYGMNAREAIDALRSGAMPLLFELDRHQEIVELTKSLVVRAPYYTADMNFLLGSEVKALLKLGQPAEALKEAKRLYNVAPMTDMEDVMTLLVECLQAAHPNDRSIADTFKREQIEGYDAPGKASSVLASIILDVGPFAKPPDSSKASSDTLRAEEGNILLLAGKPREAKEAFQRARKSIKTDDGRYKNHSDIARAIKAEDGTVGRANEYLRSQLATEIKALSIPRNQ